MTQNPSDENDRENDRKSTPSQREAEFAENFVTLCASALFAGLTPKECREIVSCARARTFARDELLFSQGQTVRNLIVLQSGSAKHTQLSSSGDEVLLRMSGSGDPVNVQADVVGCSQTCSVRAMEQCSALIWEYSRMQALLERYPQIGRNISQILAGRLHELEERFREVATEKVARRLALVLLRLLRQVGKPRGQSVEVALSREELAQMTGTTLFTISRVLSKWAEMGFVTPKRSAVLVNDLKQLEQAGGSPGEFL
jgi:CRP-like cAMP-binding protein